MFLAGVGGQGLSLCVMEAMSSTTKLLGTMLDHCSWRSSKSNTMPFIFVDYLSCWTWKLKILNRRLMNGVYRTLLSSFCVLLINKKIFSHKHQRGQIDYLWIIANTYHRGVWSSGLGWCTRCVECVVQGSSPNMDSIGLPPLVSLTRLESYGLPSSSCTPVGLRIQWVECYYGHAQVGLPH